MAYQNNRGRALEANPEALEFQFLAIDVNRPPYVPPIQPPIRELNGWVPYIAGVLADMVQAKAQDNNLRTYMFNMCAPNNFANQFFDELVITATDFAAWLMDTQRYTDRDAVAVAVEDINDMFVAVNCRDYPDLWNYVHQNSVADIEAEINKFDSVGRDIANWKRQSQGGGNARRGGTYQAPSNNRGGGNRGSSYSAGAVPSRGNSYSDRPAANTGRTAAAAAPRRSWADRRDQAPVQQEAVQQVETQAPVRVEPKELPATFSSWRPSKKVPYFLSYDLSEHIATLVKEADGSTKFNITERETPMDFNAHATPNAFGKPPAFLDLSNAARSVESVRGGIKRLNKEADLPPPEEGKPSLRTAISDKWVFEQSEASAWLMASLERQARDVGETRADAFRVYGIVSDSVLTVDEENHFVEKLGQTKTFLGLKGLLETLGGEMSLELVGVINRRMTQLVNRKVRLEMGLDISIDSFREDIEGLIDILESKWGVKAAFLKNQQAEIGRTVMPMKAALRENFVNTITAGMNFGEVKPIVACVSSLYSLTFLDLVSWEIGVEVGENGIPARVTKELTPMYYDLVKGAFDDAASYHLEGSTESSVARVLFRTLDGRILEGTKGALIDDAYLLTLVD